MADQFIIETRGLAKEFNGFLAVNDVNLRVRRGHIHALIGPNGAGKTTCFNLLTKFLIPTRGRILFKGEDITHARAAEVARRGMVRSFQVSAVFPHLTVLENVRIASAAHARYELPLLEARFEPGSAGSAGAGAARGGGSCVIRRHAGGRTTLRAQARA
jgi:ABC-type branched-subunit amino acid transport system ATPase component